MKTLVIAPQWIGDAVMAEPLLRLLHAQGQRLTIGALPWVAPVFEAMPDVVDRVIALPFAHGGLQLKARLDWARQLKTLHFECAYVLPNSFKSGLLPWLARIPRRVGYLGEARYGLLTHWRANPAKSTPPGAITGNARKTPDKPPMVAFYAALANLGVEKHAFSTLAQLPNPQLQISSQQIQTALKTFGLQQGSYTVFAPGAEYGPAKRWPLRHFAALAGLLAQPVVLLGSAKEAVDCETIAAAAGSSAQCLNLAGKTPLLQAMALIAGSAGVVSNDSGLMHVAAALGVPQAAVFGSSSPLHTPPLNRRAAVLWLKNDQAYQPPLDCAPCFARVCPLGHLRCLNDIEPERVQHALLAIAR